MSRTDVVSKIEEALGAVPFDPSPAELVTSCRGVRDALRALLPPGSVLEVYAREGRLVVRACVGDVACEQSYPLV